jgi:small subunit ribosomal protein S14
MAKKSSVEKNERRKRMTAQHAAKRAALKEIVRKPSSTADERAAAQVALQKLPRNSAKERIRNRCSMTGRSRGNLREFGLSRMVFREMALQGLIPGVRKASW